MPDSPHFPTTAYDAVFGDEACPSWARESFDRYVKHGIPTGDFLRAILANDLMSAARRADVDCGRALVAITGYVHRHVPLTAHGSYKIVDEWVLMHREKRAKAQGAE
jgi:hypothetical protein